MPKPNAHYDPNFASSDSTRNIRKRKVRPMIATTN